MAICWQQVLIHWLDGKDTRPHRGFKNQSHLSTWASAVRVSFARFGLSTHALLVIPLQMHQKSIPGCEARKHKK
eukprot:scaffold454240_cov25-Prasinocladus_malaysianus.AAC.1